MPPRASATSSPSGIKRKRPQAKPSARYQRILEDEAYEAEIQQTYAPPPAHNLSTRTLPLHVRRQREDYEGLPGLRTMCLQVASRNFLTHVLPSQETFDMAKDADSKKRPAARTSVKEKTGKRRIVSRGIGGRPIFDEETSAGKDYVPSDEEDDEVGSSNIGIAATRKRAAGSRSSRSAGSDVTAVLAQTTKAELAEISKANHEILKHLPDDQMNKLLQLLRLHCPQALTRQTLTTYFVNGRSNVELDASMVLLAEKPDQVNLILRNINPPVLSSSLAPPPPPLLRLSLSGLTRLAPEALSSLFRRCDRLEEVVLRGCVRVDASCMTALMERNASSLKLLNASFTDIGLEGVETIISKGRSLQVLKLADVLGLTEKATPEMLRRAVLKASEARPPFIPLASLQTLKLRGTDVRLQGLCAFVRLCKDTLTNLDAAGVAHHEKPWAANALILLADSLGYHLTPDMVQDVDEQVAFEGSRDDLPRASSTLGAPRQAPLQKLNLSDNFHERNGFYIQGVLSVWLHQLSPTLESFVLNRPGHVSLYTCYHNKRVDYEVPHLKRFALTSMNMDGAGDSPPALPNVRDLLTPTSDSGIPIWPSFLDYCIRLDFSGSDLSKQHFLALGKKKYLSCHSWGIGVVPRNETYDPENRPGRSGGIDQHASDVRNQHRYKLRDWPHLKELNLSHTGVRDEQVLALARRCPQLDTIHLAGTHVTSEGISELLQETRFLTKMDLTGCRGVKVSERRNAFEILGPGDEDEEEHAEDGKNKGKEREKSEDQGRTTRRRG